ncbi:MAG: ribosome maturation factor RimM [Bryobacteraceae bacterium]
MSASEDFGAPQEWITVAVLGRTRGNRGELTATAFGAPERFSGLGRVFLFGGGEPAEVESAWFHGGRLVLKFRGIDSISEAEKLSGCEVRIPRAERAALDPGEYFLDDLAGCQVFERDGKLLGEVKALHEYGGPPLLELDGGLLIPFARAICIEIDPAARRIVVELPEGLKDLNEP